MQILDLYKDRRYSIVKLGDGKDYKLPAEYYVDETERLLEAKIKQEEIETTEVENEKDKIHIDAFWNNIFYQLEIAFQHYQPEVDAEYLKKHVTHNEALEIVGFFQKYRELAIKKIFDQDEDPDAKKKL